MDINKSLIEIAEKTILKALSTEDEKGIHKVINIELDGKIKPLFLVGYVSQEIEDGSCIAILNPDKDLISRIESNVGYSGAILKKIIAQKCDCMVQIWLDAYKKGNDRIAVLSKYKSRSFSNPKSVAVPNSI